MGDDSVLLDHARRYFAQAGQSRDVKKMRMLAELGFEYLRLIQQGERPRAREGSTPDQGASGKVEK